MADNASTTMASTIRSIVELAKGLDTRDLAEIKPIGAVNDGVRDLKVGAPGSEVIVTGPAIAARGGDVNAQIHRRSDLVPQEAMTADYQELARRLEGLSKAVDAQSRVLTTLVEGFRKAGTGDKGDEVRDETKEEGKAEVEKCFRRARLSLKKAEDESEDADDRKDAMEKAQAAVAAAAVLVAKAEDEVEDDVDEKEWMKSASTLKAIRTQLRAVVAKATPATAATATTTAATPTPTPVTKTDTAAVTKDDIAEMLKGMWDTSMPEIIAKIAGGASKIGEPPAFMKAATADTLGDIAARAAVANDLGQISDMAFAKCQSLLGRVDAVSKGNGDAEAVYAAITGADDSVKALFAPLLNLAA